MSRTLIDLTDLALWEGQYAGTQRVVHHIAKEYAAARGELDGEVVFIVYRDADRAFCAVPFEEVAQSASSKAGRAGAAPVGQPHWVRRLYARLPGSVRSKPAVRLVAGRMLQVARSAYQKGRSMAQERSGNRQIRGGPAVSFRSDDTVVLLGKPWDNPGIQATLSAERARLGFKVVELVYDLIICLQPQLHHPSLFGSYTRHLFEAVSNSDGLLAISQSTARDLEVFARRLNLPLPPVEVIRLGDELPRVGGESAKPDARIAQRFIACIGTLEVRKNHALLYYAYKLAGAEGIELPQLVIVGRPGWLAGDVQHLFGNDPAMDGRVLLLGSVDDQGLAWIYEHCCFTVYPSMYEGWGLPVAESLAYGKPCLAAEASSVPEIGGSLVDYFSPYDPRGCLDRMVAALEPGYLDHRSAAIREGYRLTPWRATFEQVEKALRQLPLP